MNKALIPSKKESSGINIGIKNMNSKICDLKFICSVTSNQIKINPQLNKETIMAIKIVLNKEL